MASEGLQSSGTTFGGLAHLQYYRLCPLFPKGHWRHFLPRATCLGYILHSWAHTCWPSSCCVYLWGSGEHFLITQQPSCLL